MLTDIALSKHHAWYYRYEIQYQIVKSLYNREFALLVPKCFAESPIVRMSGETINMSRCSVRNLRCHNQQSIKYILFNRDTYRQGIVYNLYYSMATYKNGVPYGVPGNIILTDKTWGARHWREMIAYDLLIDIDAGDHNEMQYAKESTLAIIEMFDILEVPYDLRLSGMGYHVIVPYEYFSSMNLSFDPDNTGPDSLYDLYRRILKFLYDYVSEMTDTSIIDSRRVCKIPYSLSFYEKNVIVCWPFLTKNEFMHHVWTDYTTDEVTYKDVTNRGLHTFNKSTQYTPQKLLDYIQERCKKKWRKKEEHPKTTSKDSQKESGEKAKEE